MPTNPVITIHIGQVGVARRTPDDNVIADAACASTICEESVPVTHSHDRRPGGSSLRESRGSGRTDARSTATSLYGTWTPPRNASTYVTAGARLDAGSPVTGIGTVTSHGCS